MMLGVGCEEGHGSELGGDRELGAIATPQPAHPLPVIAKPALAQFIDAAVEDTLVADGPGVAVLVMQAGEILHAKGYGWRDVAAQRPVTPNTVFDLASVSKQMTALGLLILMERGDLALDDPVVAHLPEFVDPNPDNPIVLLDLLHHTSGLADYTDADWDDPALDFTRMTLEEHLQWLNQQDPYSDRQTEFAYNNSGYALLALVIQRVSGQPFPAFMDAAIFQPLGMTQTHVYRHLGQTFPEQAQGYSVAADDTVTPASLPSLMTGDGNVFSSIRDLAQYDRALRTHALVTPETWAIAFTPGSFLDEDTGAAYGLGWELSATYADHRGGWDGTSTYYRHNWDQALTIIVLANDENYDALALAEAIAAWLDNHHTLSGT